MEALRKNNTSLTTNNKKRKLKNYYKKNMQVKMQRFTCNYFN